MPGVTGGSVGVGLREDGTREALLISLRFFCFNFNFCFWRESFLFWIFNFIFSFGVGATSEPLEELDEELDVDAALVLELEGLGAAIGVGT